MSTLISIIVPFYNEEENVKPLFDSIEKAMKNLGKDYELIFVDDGSNDRTGEELLKVKNNSKQTKIIVFCNLRINNYLAA